MLELLVCAFFALHIFSGNAFRIYEFNKVTDGQQVIACLAKFHLIFNNVPTTAYWGREGWYQQYFLPSDPRPSSGFARFIRGVSIC